MYNTLLAFHDVITMSGTNPLNFYGVLWKNVIRFALFRYASDFLGT